MSDLRSIPSVDQLLKEQSILDWVEAFGRPLTLRAIRDTLDEVRADYSEDTPVPEQAALMERVQRKLVDWTEPSLRSVINASGVILHTNLGRAPLSRSALQAVEEISSGY